jgi:hypothetical protein
MFIPPTKATAPSTIWSLRWFLRLRKKRLRFGSRLWNHEKLAARRREVPEQLLREAVGADAVEEQADDDAAPGGLVRSRGSSRPSRRRSRCRTPGGRGASPPDPVLERRVEFLGVAQDAQAARGADGKLVDAREQLEELPVPPGSSSRRRRGGARRSMPAGTRPGARSGRNRGTAA